MVRISDRSGPIEFRLTRCVEDAPIRTNAAFEDFPWLVDCFNDVVVDSKGFRARHEIAQRDCLFDPARIGVLKIVSGARPAELGDDNSFAGICLT